MMIDNSKRLSRLFQLAMSFVFRGDVRVTMHITLLTCKCPIRVYTCITIDSIVFDIGETDNTNVDGIIQLRTRSCKFFY